MLGVRLNGDAGRAAYLAGFHAAQAFIFQNRGKVFKTHRGVQTEFLRLTKDDLRIQPDLRKPTPRKNGVTHKRAGADVPGALLTRGTRLVVR